MAFQDFEAYEVIGGAPAAFIASPIRIENKLQGVLMVQVSIDQINAIMQERTGMGQTGESYLVGTDGLFRSDSIHIPDSTVINPDYPVETEGVNKALRGESGQGLTANYRGKYVLSAYTPVNFHDVIWAMIAEIEVNEAFVPKEADEDQDYFAKYLEEYGYEDIALLDKDGFMFYSVNKGNDFHKNVLTDEALKDTHLGQLATKVFDTGIMATSDLAKYKPGGNQPVLFVCAPVTYDENVELMVVVKLSSDKFDEIMHEETGLGKTAETYLVGTDQLWRSNSIAPEKLKVKSTVLNPKVKVDTRAAKDALAGKQATDVIKNYQGEKVLSSWSPLVISEPTLEDLKGVRWAVISEISYDEVQKPIRDMMIVTGIILFIVVGLVLTVSFWLAGSLTIQVDHIMDVFGEIGMGNFKERSKVDTRDELGQMAVSLNAMLDNTLSLIQSSDERDSMQTSIMRLLEEISGLAEGNLMARAEVTEDFTGAIADSFNDMAEQLGDVVKNVKDVTLQISTTSKDVMQSTEHLADTSETQAVQVSDTIAAINEMAASIQQVAENAGQCAVVSEEATKHTKEGAESVRSTNKAMESIREYVQETARAIKRLGESSQEVGNIVQLITDIADRTSILALNASIQAAMAGEAGRGFAVVAEEVQRLAERSTNATQQIDTLIKNIQGEINEAGTSMEESIQRVVDGSKLADSAYGKLQDIENITNKLGELIHSISLASKQQARASENIASTVQEVGEVSSQTSAASRQTATAMKSLTQISDELNESVSVFKLDDSEVEAEPQIDLSESTENFPNGNGSVIDDDITLID